MPVPPKVIIICSRLDDEQAASAGLDTAGRPTGSYGSHLFLGDDHLNALIRAWGKIFGKVLEWDEAWLADHLIAAMTETDGTGRMPALSASTWLEGISSIYFILALAKMACKISATDSKGALLPTTC